MKHYIKYKQFVTVFLALLVCVVAPLVPATASALASTQTQRFAATGVTCGPGETDVPISEGKTSLAHTCCPTAAAKTTGEGQSASCLFAKYINPLINLMSAAVGVIAVIAIIWGAIQFSSSGGDPQRAANGKNHIRNALLGLLAYLLLYAFLQFLIPGGKFNG